MPRAETLPSICLLISNVPDLSEAAYSGFRLVLVSCVEDFSSFALVDGSDVFLLRARNHLASLDLVVPSTIEPDRKSPDRTTRRKQFTGACISVVICLNEIRE